RDQQTGTATFLVAAVPDNTGTTAIGTSTTIATTVIGENAVRTFTATAGQKAVFFVSANSYSGGAEVSVIQPSGAGLTSLFVSAATRVKDVSTLPALSLHAALPDSRDQQTGTATFLVAAVPDNTGTTAIGTPTAVTTTAIGETADRTFAGTAG